MSLMAVPIIISCLPQSSFSPISGNRAPGYPSILLADEPTGNLDSQNTVAVLKLLKDLNQRLGQTILMITHDHEAAAYADRIVQMRDGQIL